MDNNEFKLEESGINPVNTAGSDKDVYFSNVDNDDIPAAAKTATVKRSAPKQKKSQGVASTYVFFIVVIVLSMVIKEMATVVKPVAMMQASLALYLLLMYIWLVNRRPIEVLPTKEDTASTAERPGVFHRAWVRGRRNTPIKSTKP